MCSAFFRSADNKPPAETILSPLPDSPKGDGRGEGVKESIGCAPFGELMIFNFRYTNTKTGLSRIPPPPPSYPTG